MLDSTQAKDLHKLATLIESGINVTLTTGDIEIGAVEIKNAIYRDTGNKLEYLKTIVEYGLDHNDIGDDFKNYLENLVLQERN